MQLKFPSFSQRIRTRVLAPRQILILCFTGLILLVLTSVTKNHSTRNRLQSSHKTESAELKREAVANSLAALEMTEAEAPAHDKLSANTRQPFPGDFSTGSNDPRLNYSAELAVATREFAHARTSMEDILERHRGYTSRLRMSGQSTGNVLSATLKIPATEFSSALGELKTIGTVERDEESADEIAQQNGDLNARLQNARNTERRLQQLLGENSKSLDRGAISSQLAEIRSAIERLEAQRREFDSRVIFSNIHFAIREDRPVPVQSLGTQLRSALAVSLAEIVRSLSAVLLFFANFAVPLFVWAAILYFPARFLWRRARPQIAATSA